MLFKVYDSKGECFEVTPNNAKRLVIDEGWSMEEPAQKTFSFVSPDPEVIAEVTVNDKK